MFADGRNADDRDAGGNIRKVHTHENLVVNWRFLLVCILSKSPIAGVVLCECVTARQG